MLSHLIRQVTPLLIGLFIRYLAYASYVARCGTGITHSGIGSLSIAFAKVGANTAGNT